MSNENRELFDADEFRVQFESDALKKQLIEIFPEETSHYLEKARRALAEKDGEGLHLAAHTLKGTVGNYLGTRAFAASTALDRLARNHDFPAARIALENCETEVKALGEALRKFQAEEIDKSE